MTSELNPSRRTFSLAKQGLLLVAIFLLYEFGFIGTLALLLSQVEKEASEQEFARQLSSKADRLMLIVYDRGDAVGRYARSLQMGATDQTSASVDEVSSLLTWLKDALKDRAEARALVDKIDQHIGICLPLHNEIGSMNSAHPLDHREWEKKTEVVQPVIKQLVVEIPALIKIARAGDNFDPEDERRKRQLTEQVLLFGMLTNFGVVLLSAVLFSKRITSRLDVLIDNTIRLKDGRELRPLVGGSDEITIVDGVFHKTAEALRRELQVLKAGEERIRALIENLPIGIVLIDTKGSIELINSSIETTFNYSSHQLLGKRLTKLFQHDQPVIDGAPHSQQSQIAFKHSVELTALSHDGAAIPVDFMMAEIQLEGESKILAMIVDATEKFKIRKLRQDFVFMVRSELKQPLINVSAFLSRFAAGSWGEITEQCATTTRAMQQNIERLIVLLNDLFDLEKLEAGQIDIEPEAVSLQSIFDRSESAVSMFAQKHKVSLELPTTDCILYADQNRLVQVIVNLLSNAIKFSPPNASVVVGVEQTSDYTRINIVDQGPGIPAAQAAAIFEAYQQVEGQDLKKGGTGLGLTICKSIIEAHRGEIGVNSEVGKGSVFWFQLPVVARNV